jgi:hypothetical protein
MGELEYIQLRTDAQPRTTNPTRMMILSYLPKRAVTGIHCLNLLHQPPYETKKKYTQSRWDPNHGHGHEPYVPTNPKHSTIARIEEDRVDDRTYLCSGVEIHP